MYFAFSDYFGNTNYSKLYAIEKIMDENYYEDLDKEKMGEYAAAGFVAGSGDAYTNYMSADEYALMMSGMEDNNYQGIGVEISTAEEKMKVSSVMAGSPANKAGILPGDYIIKVNGKEYTSYESSEAISSIKSTPEGSCVTVTVERNSQIFDFEIKVEYIEVKNVTCKMADEKTGYIRIRSFGENTGKDFINACESLLESNMQALVIDLRGNPGGMLDTVVEALDYLLPEGVITTIKYKNRDDDVYRSDSKFLDIPICVLIDENSASASEIMAGALKDYGRATLVGKTTYGKGVVQGMFTLRDKSVVRVTIARYYTPNGVCIDKIGIKPDLEVDLPEGKTIGNFDSGFENDAQFEKAMEVLKD